MDTAESSGIVPPVKAPAGGVWRWLRAWLRDFFVAEPAPGAVAPAGAAQPERKETYVIAPGGYRIRVPQVSDVSQSVGEMLTDVRDGLELLPPLPHVVSQLLHEIQDANSTASSVAEIASSDPALAASLLRTVNSAAMGLNRKITSVSEAVSYLGFGMVRSMVVRLRLGEMMPAKTEQAASDLQDLWIHALAVSHAAECLAQRIGGVDKGFVSTLGLLHDVGKIAIIARLPDHAEELRKLAAGAEGYDRLAMEARVLGVDHACLGADLAARWRLPADLVQGIRWHHRPAAAFHATDPLPLRKAVHIVQIANQLAKYCYPYADQVEINALSPEGMALVGLGPDLPALLDGPIRAAIGRAIFFAESSTPRKATSPRRFLRLLQGDEARAAVEGDAAEAPRVLADTGEIEALRQLCRQNQRDCLRLTAPKTPADLEAMVGKSLAHLAEMKLPTQAGSTASFFIAALLPNLMPLKVFADEVELMQARRGEQMLLSVACAGLSAANRLGGQPGVDAARRLAEADMAPVLNLGWFEKISISASGDTMMFVTK